MSKYGIMTIAPEQTEKSDPPKRTLYSITQQVFNLDWFFLNIIMQPYFKFAKSIMHIKSVSFQIIVTLYFAVFWLFVGCKEPFMPELEFKETNFLVVEGYINIGTDAVTEIRLSRTVPVEETQTEPLRENNAVIVIEDDLENIYTLTELSNGIYISDTLSLPFERSYRIRISTSDQVEYTSDFSTPIQTPAIDSVSWVRVTDGLEVHVATHDPLGSTFYYQWDYEEVWELRSPYFSFYSYANGQFFPREESEIQAMRKCWRTATPPNLIVRSTGTFVSDAISLTLFNIPAFNERLGENYSVLIRQHALSMEAFNYLQVMIKNTNQLGTFFDPQPSQLTGNITVKGSDKAVIGFIEAYTTSEERIYIKKVDVPWWNFNFPCTTIEFSVDPETIEANFGQALYIPVTFNDVQTKMSGASPTCADCRRRGGNNNKPSFWDDVF